MAKKNAPKTASKQKGELKSTGQFQVNAAYILAACLLCTGSVYLYAALNNQFTNWDDNLYVTQNQLIGSWSVALFTSRVNANWAPVHQLLLAVQYQLFGLNALGYHLVSLGLHLCNVGLTFLLVLRLSKNQVVAGIVALLFGIHPMHAEAVVWVSAQKDLLFTFFYLAAMLAYIKYRRPKRKEAFSGIAYLLLTLVLFMLSCLSKGMGETLPVSLVLVDCLEERNWSLQYIATSIAKKAIFFIISIAFGVTAYIALKNGGALLQFNHSFSAQIMFVCYGLLVYLLKFILPFSLSPFYLYPLKDAAGTYPVIFYASPLILLALIVFVVWLFKKRRDEGKPNNILLFGLSFFLVNMILVLQLKPITVVIAAERYTYLSYTGLFFILADSFYALWQKNLQLYKTRVIVIGCSIIVVLWLGANNYAGVWHDSITLWTYVIDNFPSYPMRSMNTAYINRGIAYADIGKADFAIADYSTAIKLEPKYNFPYNDRGLAYAHQGKTELALADYDTAMSLDPTYFGAWYNRGLVYANNGKPQLALADYNKAISLNPDYSDVYNNRGLAYARQGKTDLAIADYNKAISLTPLYIFPYYNRGLVYAKLGKNEQALTDYNKALSLNPQYINVYSDRGRAFARLGKPDLALADYNAAIKLNPQFVLAYYNRGLLYAAQGQADLAIADYNTAISINSQYADVYHSRALAEEMRGNKVQAQNDMQKAKELGWAEGN